MENPDPVKLLTRFWARRPNEFQAVNDSNKFVEITHYKDASYPSLCYGDLPDDEIPEWLDDVCSSLQAESSTFINVKQKVDHAVTGQSKPIVFQTRILFAGTIPMDRMLGPQVRISGTNMSAFIQKWHIPLLFFRTAREEIAMVEPFRLRIEGNHLQGLVAAFPFGLVPIMGCICTVHDQQASITHCLCLSFCGDSQSRLLGCILDDPQAIRNPHSVLLLEIGLVFAEFRKLVTSMSLWIVRSASALSTGAYLGAGPVESLPSNVSEISRRLTVSADSCAAFKTAVIRTLRMLQDLQKLGVLTEAPDTAKEHATRTPLSFQAEGPVKYHIMAAKNHLQSCEEYLERIQAHMQTTYSLVAQKDSQANIHLAKLARRDTELNTLIATLARRDSTDMRVITWIALVFLPGTFTATFFSASFFNFQPDNSGAHVSNWIAMYWALTAALTAVVFAARAVLFRTKAKLKPNAIDKLLRETSEFVNGDDDEEEILMR